MIEQHEVVSVISLAAVAVLTTVAIFCRNYHENWLQFFGLVGIALWSAARVSQLVDMMSTRLPAQGMILHVSLALFSIGTAMKVWAHRPRANGAAPPAPYKIDPNDMQKVAGGKQ